MSLCLLLSYSFFEIKLAANEVIIFFCTKKGAVNKSLLNFTKKKIIREKRKMKQ
jgi:hypothetical protein